MGQIGSFIGSQSHPNSCRLGEKGDEMPHASLPGQCPITSGESQHALNTDMTAKFYGDVVYSQEGERCDDTHGGSGENAPTANGEAFDVPLCLS